MSEVLASSFLKVLLPRMRRSRHDASHKFIELLHRVVNKNSNCKCNHLAVSRGVPASPLRFADLVFLVNTSSCRASWALDTVPSTWICLDFLVLLMKSVQSCIGGEVELDMPFATI